MNSRSCLAADILPWSIHQYASLDKRLLYNTKYSAAAPMGGIFPKVRTVSPSYSPRLPLVKAEVTSQIHVYAYSLFIFIILHLSFHFRKSTRLNLSPRDMLKP